MEETNIKDNHNIYKYYDRALSWLSFNYRVLQESRDESLPVIDRIKFLAFHQENLYKFYVTGIATYKMMHILYKEKLIKPDFSPKTILRNIKKEIRKQELEFESVFENTIIKELSKSNVELIQNTNSLSNTHSEFIKQFFKNEVLPQIHPILLNNCVLNNYVKDETIYLVLILSKKNSNQVQSIEENKIYGLINVPTDNVPRFIILPDENQKKYIMFIDDIIKSNLEVLYPLYLADAAYSIILSRNNRLNIEEELSKKYTKQIHQKITKRKTGIPARFQFDHNMPEALVKLLKNELNISKKDMIPGYKYLNLKDLLSMPNPFKPLLESESYQPIQHQLIEKSDSLIKAIKKRDILLHFPYHSFDYIIRFFNEVALDPKVKEIKVTQYKLQKNSSLLGSLKSAALNGKKVSIYVDFRAQFDETNNLKLIEQLAEAGIRIIPSQSGSKLCAKAALIIRKKPNKENKRKGYAYFSTGNFNKKTSQIYCDNGYFTSRKEIVSDLEIFFISLEKPIVKMDLLHLVVPKFNIYENFKLLIDNEIANAKEDKKAYILLKLNNLEDKKIIDLLYHASMNGVLIDIIARGICCLMPGMKFSENIRVIRIIDKYLEHSRIFHFHQGGKKLIYLSSADLSKPIINKRIDLIVPIEDSNLKEELLHVLQIQLNDNVKARHLGNDLDQWNIPICNDEPISSQIAIYQFLNKLHQ